MTEVESLRPESGAVLGIDYGTVRIGLALGDIASGLVLPLPVLENPGSVEGALERIENVARGRSAACVVIGNPVHMSGEKSSMSHLMARMKTELERRLGVPVYLRDERLTSVNAEETLAAQGLRWWQYSKGQVDTLSAMTLVRELLIEWKPDLGKVGEEALPEEQPGRREKDTQRRDARRKGRSRKRTHPEDDASLE